MQAVKPTKIVLSIAGSDSSGGAGIAADIKTGGAFGVFVCTAITAITAQNAFAVHAIHPVSGTALREQLEAICEAHTPDAIKLGMLGNEESLRTVAEFLKTQNAPVVVDPVLGATSGSSLWQTGDAKSLYTQLLLPLATVITPNLSEAAALLEAEPAESYEQMEVQARALQALGAQSVLLKGGHLTGPQAPDCLAEQELTPFTTARVDTRHSHGSGCTLATAIACGLAQGLNLKQAVAAAKTYIQGALAGADRLQLVADNGPLHHFYSYW